MRSQSSQKLDVKRPALSVNAYIKEHQREFSEFYSNLIEDFALLSNMRFFIAFSLFASNVSNFTRTHDILSLSVNIPSIAMLLAYPLLRQRSIIPQGFGTIWCFLFMLTLSLQWSFSFWIFARNDLSKLGPTVVTIVLSMLWMFALGPNPLRNILKASLASAIFIISMYLIRPAYIVDIQGGLVVGLLLGFGLRKSLDQMLRFRFFISEQNKVLELKNAKIDSIFKASPVGMLIIAEDQTIGGDLSPAVQHTLGSDIRAGMPFRKVLAASLNSEADKQATVSALDAMLGEPLLNYELNRDLLLHRLHIKHDGIIRTLKLSYSPLLDSEQIVREILVICDDLTDTDNQERDYQITRIEGATLLVFIGLRKNHAEAYLKSCQDFLETFRKSESNPNDREKKAELLRILHTLKGNSRTLGFKDLAEVMHELESDIIAKSHRMDSHGKSRADLIRSIMEFLLGFSRNYQLKEDTEVRISLQQYCQELIASTAGAACPLAGRAVPDVVVEVTDPSLDTPALRNIVFQVLPHLVTNAIDHGLETPEQRRASGKPEQGRIHLTLTRSGESCVWHFRDDGRGLDLQALRGKIGPKSERQSDDEVAQLIFSRGLTTAKSVTSLSGRGVGLEAVAAVLQDMGGTYRVCILPRVGEFHPFYFEFISPLNPSLAHDGFVHAV